MRLCPIVEGHGDVEATPILLRRIALETAPNVPLEVLRPIRIPKDKLVKEGELERAVALARLKLGEHGGAVLVLLDCEHPGCPAHEGPALLARATAAGAGTPAAVVLAHQEFETWFLAAARSLAGLRGLKASLTPPNDPESIRGAKEWLTRHMSGSNAYSETLDQPAFAAAISLDEARTASSFDKLWRDVTTLLV